MSPPPEWSRTNRDVVTGCDDNPGDTAIWAISATGYDQAGHVAWSQSPTQYQAAPGDTTFDANFATVYGYDVMGRQSTVTTADPANPGVATVTTGLCYTARGELSRLMDPAGNVTAYEYLPSGAVERVVDPRGMPNSPADLCDADPIDSTTATIIYGYDGQGRRTSRTSYDNNGDPIAELWTWDGANREASYTDQLDRVTTTDNWISDGILYARATWTDSTNDPVDPSGSSRRVKVQGTYPSGRPQAMWDVRLDTTGSYAGSHMTTYSYDQAGNRTSVHGESFDATSTPLSDETVSFDHDQGGNIIKVVYTSGLEASYLWDVGGRQIEQVLASGTKYRYNYGINQLIDDVDLYAGGTWLPLVDYTYDAEGKQLTETLLGGTGGHRYKTYAPSTGLLTSFDQQLLDPNAINPTLVSHWETTWDTTGRLASDCLNIEGASCEGSDRVVTYDYDQAGQLTEAIVTNPHQTDPDRWAYSYGNRGERLTHTVEDTTSVVTTTYSFNEALQLLEANPDNSDPTTVYDYDYAGRRMSRSNGISSLNYSYDVRGLLTTDGVASLSYDPMQYLSGGYYYDYSQRTAIAQLTMVGDETSMSGFDLLNGVIKLDWNNPEQITLYGQDPLGSLTEFYDVTNSGRSLFNPYGEHIGAQIETGPLTYRAELSTTDELTYLRARWYDPVTGTFITKDPMDGVDGTATVANPYHYADNNPLNKTDPLGLRPGDSQFVRDGTSVGASGCRPGQPCLMAGFPLPPLPPLPPSVISQISGAAAARAFIDAVFDFEFTCSGAWLPVTGSCRAYWSRTATATMNEYIGEAQLAAGSFVTIVGGVASQVGKCPPGAGTALCTLLAVIVGYDNYLIGEAVSEAAGDDACLKWEVSQADFGQYINGATSGNLAAHTMLVDNLTTKKGSGRYCRG